MASFLNTIVLLGALQGFIISLLLIFRPGNLLPNRLLAWLILLMSLASLNIYFLNTGWFETTVALRIIAALVPLVIIMPMGPFIYFYIRSITDSGFTIGKKERLHFLPAIIDIIPQLAALLFFAGRWAGWWQDGDPWNRFIDNCNVYSDIPRWLSLTVYIFLTKKYLAGQTGTDAGRQRWFRQFIYVFLGFLLIWLVYLIPYSIPALTDRLLRWVDWYPVYIPMAIMIYWMGIKGYLLSLQTAGKKANKSMLTDFPAERLEPTVYILKRAMEDDRIFLNPALNLDLLAAHTGIASKTISMILNQYIGKGFNEWINEYRLNEFKHKLSQSNLKQLTISGIASECGFNSQATFQRIFKQSLGMTPTEYLKSLQSGS
ncbi:MAG: helix-turn-helix domain-containing protein [Chitinophagaceae bacterium]